MLLSLVYFAVCRLLVPLTGVGGPTRWRDLTFPRLQGAPSWPDLAWVTGTSTGGRNPPTCAEWRELRSQGRLGHNNPPSPDRKSASVASPAPAGKALHAPAL
jgi:hypothetical protein